MHESNPNNMQEENLEPKASPDNSPSRTKTKKSYLLGMVIGGVLILGGAALAYQQGWIALRGKTDEPGTVLSESVSVAALVNGVEISAAEVNGRRDQLLANVALGDATEPAPELLQQAQQLALQQLINETLLLQAANASQVTISDDDIEAQFRSVQEQFVDEQAFSTALINANVTEDQVRGDIARRLTIEAYVEQETDVENTSVTEEEIVALYDTYAGQQETMPALEEIHAQLEQQVRQQKIDTEVNGLLQRLSAGADISIL